MYVSPKHTQEQPMMKSKKKNVFQHVICVVIEKHKFPHTHTQKAGIKKQRNKNKTAKDTR